MTIILELVNIVKNYKNKKGQTVEALKGISFCFPENGMVFIVGKSGSGKSTLLNILGFLDTYDEGKFLINGKYSKDFSEQERDEFRAQEIGFVFQEFHIIEKYSIGQNISLPLEIQHDGNGKERVKEILKKVQLEGYENRKPTEISGGQKQRIAIARAIIKDPQIILADEPTGSLDSVTGAEIFNILQELSKNKLVIVISHDIESAHKYADQIIELKDGLVDSVYDGDGGAESVRFVVNQIESSDIEKYNNILNEGKKVSLTKVKSKKRYEKLVLIAEQPKLNKGVKLPFKSSLKLSFFSMKSKWVRTFFTILISMFAVAFFGFTDIISSFRADELFIQDLVNNDAKFVSIGVNKVESEGLVNDYIRTVFEKEQAEVFENLAFNSFTQRKFFTYPAMNTKKYHRILPDNVSQYYYSNFCTYTEVNNVTELGYVIKEGRDVENINEIVITSYHMSVYKIFGFDNNEIIIDSVTEFNQIKDLEINVSTSTNGEDLRLRIVGLVETDLSEYDAISSITTKINSISKENRSLVRKFSSRYMDINSIFVKKGFYEYLEEQVSLFRIYKAQLTYQERLFTSLWSNIRKITNEIFEEQFTLKEGINSIEDIGDDQIVISAAILEKYFPGEKIRTKEDVQSILETSISLVSNVMDGTSSAFSITKELEIVGVHFSSSDLCFVSNNISDDARVDIIQTYKIPSQNRESHASILQAIKESEEFAVDVDVFKFFVDTPNHNVIKTVDRYFTLFVNLFATLAIVLFVFAIILNYTFISQSIELRKKDIGILRSLGARKKDVAGIFIIEGAVTAILEIVLGVITCYIGYKALDNYFVNRLGEIAEMYEIVKFELRQIMLMTIVTITAVSIALFVPIHRISNKQPVDAIRN